ncbi:MAG: methionine biosynthesis protein MetW [Candidatus Geothermincolia bacterium]
MSRKRAVDKAPAEAVSEETLQDLSLRLREKSPNGHRIQSFDDDALMESLHETNACYDKNLPGAAESERVVSAPFVAFLKKIVRKLTSWYVEPALDQQRAFNASITRTVNEMKQYMDHIQINEDILSTILHRDLAMFRANILFLNKYLERRMVDFDNELLALHHNREVEPAGAAPEPGGNGGGNADDVMAAIDVLTLEQRVHGSPRMVKDRQRVYLPYFSGCQNVLAIGCGRGELLQLLAQEGVTARGTETNPTLVDYCKDNGLQVQLVDPLDYLEALEDGSLDGLVLSRFAGHEPPARLVRMLTMCRKKLTGGSPLVIETPNPFSLYAVASYALESAEQAHPLHPETLKQMCLSYGFNDPTVMFLNPLPPEEHLEELALTSSGAILDARQQELFHQVNENFVKLNRILFSHRDYAVVTRREH